MYADADYAAASNDRRSVSGVAEILGDTAIGWKSSTQKCVTTATCEVEYVAFCDASKEALFTRAALVFLQSELSGMRVEMFGDNKGAKAIADNSSSSASSSKHIEVELHFTALPYYTCLSLVWSSLSSNQDKGKRFWGLFSGYPKTTYFGLSLCPYGKHRRRKHLKQLRRHGHGLEKSSEDSIICQNFMSGKVLFGSWACFWYTAFFFRRPCCWYRM